MPDRLTPPWKATHEPANNCFKVETADGFALVHIHHVNPAIVGTQNGRLTEDQARKLATAISRIPARQWPADVKAALVKLHGELSGVPADFDDFVHWYMRDALIGIGALPPYISDDADQ